MYARHSRFSHPVPLGTPSLDVASGQYGASAYAVSSANAGTYKVTDGGTIWKFDALLFPEDTDNLKVVYRNGAVADSVVAANTPEARSLMAQTTAAFSDFEEAKRAAISRIYAQTQQAWQRVVPRPTAMPTAPAATTPAAAPAAPSYYAPAPGAPGTQPPATTDSGSITDKPWFWPAVGAGAIGLVALVWAFMPASSAPKVIIKRAASRFTGF